MAVPKSWPIALLLLCCGLVRDETMRHWELREMASTLARNESPGPRRTVEGGVPLFSRLQLGVYTKELNKAS